MDRMNDPRVSVLIATSNRPKAFVRCLQSVNSQTYDNLEIVTLDYSEEINSCERVADVLSDTSLDCTHVEEPYGVAGSRNWLMEQASGDIFVFIDDDARFADDKAIARAVKGFEADVGIQAFKIIDNPESDGGRHLSPVPAAHRSNVNLDESFQTSYFVGAGHAFRRTVIEDCGDYEDDMMYGMEEIDISYRAIENGWTIMYNPDVVVHHYPEPPVIDKDSTGHSELHYDVANRIYFAVRHLPIVYLLSYLCIWLGYLALQAVKRGSPREYITGIKRGITLSQKTTRHPMSDDGIAYLRENHGRLWY